MHFVFFAASTIARLSPMVYAVGFSMYTSLPACAARTMGSGVPVVGGRDQQRVDLLAIDGPAEVLIRIDARRQQRLGLRDLARVGIAQEREFRLLLQELPGHEPAPAPQPIAPRHPLIHAQDPAVSPGLVAAVASARAVRPSQSLREHPSGFIDHPHRVDQTCGDHAKTSSSYHEIPRQTVVHLVQDHEGERRDAKARNQKGARRTSQSDLSLSGLLRPPVACTHSGC